MSTRTVRRTSASAGNCLPRARFSVGPAELKDGRVFACDHFGAQFDFHRAAVAGVGHKIPDGGRAGVETTRDF